MMDPAVKMSKFIRSFLVHCLESGLDGIVFDVFVYTYIQLCKELGNFLLNSFFQLRLLRNDKILDLQKIEKNLNFDSNF